MGPQVLNHLASEVIWQHKQSGCVVKVEANCLELLTQLIPLFVESLSKSKQNHCLDLDKLKTVPKANITSFNKVNNNHLVMVGL